MEGGGRGERSRRGFRERAAPAVALTGAALALALTGCLEWSPHAIPLDEADTDVTRKSLERLLAQPEPEVLRFAAVGDTQGDFAETELVVDALNAIDGLSLVLQLGDITHQGIGPEYRAMNRIFRRLRVPYFAVIGNHDLLANGGDIYDHMFGPRDLSFTYARVRFVLFDSNAVEYGFGGNTPDLAWLREAIAGGEPHDVAILAAHVDPGSSDWDPALREPYFALLRELGVRVSFYGHAHRPGQFERDGGVFYVPGAVEHRSFVVVAVHRDGRIEVERRSF